MTPVTQLRPDRRVPSQDRLVHAAMETQARCHELQSGLEELARYAWATQQPWLLKRLSRLIGSASAGTDAARVVSGIADGIACADGVGAPGHGLAA